MDLVACSRVIETACVWHRELVYDPLLAGGLAVFTRRMELRGFFGVTFDDRVERCEQSIASRVRQTQSGQAFFTRHVRVPLLFYVGPSMLLGR